MAILGSLDWTRPDLKLAYLVEGVLSPSGGSWGSKKVVRWCGPKIRTGSGTLARRTLADDGTPITGSGAADRAAPPGDPTGWEARLSKGVYDQSLGGWKRSVQSINDVKFTVDLSPDDDNLDTEASNINDLLDNVLRGRWRGQRARLIVVDLEDIDNFEVLVDGTWDRDPDEVKQGSFRMTIVAGNIIPPTLPWFMWQCPNDVPPGWNSYTAIGTGGSNPDWNPVGYGRQWPSTFALSDNCKGKWIGPSFGGRSGETNANNWAEIIPYGYVGSTSYGLASPGNWDMVYDVFYTDASGNHERVASQTDKTILVAVNTAPARGPLGTIVRWTDDGTLAWKSEGTRVFAKLGGTGSGPRPSSWGSGENNQPFVGANRLTSTTSTTGEAYPLGTPSAGTSELSYILRTIFEEAEYGIAGTTVAGLHTDAIPDLYVGLTLIQQKSRRCCRIPRDLVDEPPSMANVLSDLMESIPADLILRRDPAVGFPRYYPRVRPTIGGLVVDYSIDVSALYRSEVLDIVTLDDPDGFYANEVSYEESVNDNGIEGTSSDVGRMPETVGHAFGLRDLAEQGPEGTNQPILGEKKIKFWMHDFDGGEAAGAQFFLRYVGRQQKVMEATHGIQAMAMQLGETIRYLPTSVLRWAGQIRGMRLDLDRQTVAIKSYHWKAATSTTSTVFVDEGVEDKQTGEIVDIPLLGVDVLTVEQVATGATAASSASAEPTTRAEKIEKRKKEDGEEN
tara:strand:- start:8478 stop:10673 length:2196 start_codon:yes stop_codon:yes gene_type:complete